MPRNTVASIQQKQARQLLPSMLNKRRYSLKKILNRYMGLPFSQYQPAVTSEDLHEAGLGEAFVVTLNELLPAEKKKLHVVEQVSIEVRGVAIAFDEEVSFSPYRQQSLQSPVYSLPILPRLYHYQAYCQRYMPQQNSPISEAVEEALRKRALQDFMQDMLPAVCHMPLIRLSVYDRFSDGDTYCCLGNILEADSERYYLSIADRINCELERIDKLFMTAF